MKMKFALGVFLVSMSATVFANPHYNDRGHDRYDRQHDRYDRHNDRNYGKHHPRVQRVCYLNGRPYAIGSVVKEYRRVKVCDRVRGKTMWLARDARR